jgi:hypothetical protein
MKTKVLAILLALLCGVVGSVATIQYFSFNDTKRELAAATSQNIQANIQVTKLEAELKKFDNIEKADLLTACNSRASNAYTEYIRNNSISSIEGSVTTFTPKSSDILRKAAETLGASKKSCTDRFS